MGDIPKGAVLRVTWLL